MHSKDTYTRKQRKPRIPLIDQCSLLMTSERDEKAKGNKTTKPKKLKISKASSPSNNVSKNMKIMNNEVYSSKKFLVEIESRDTFTDFEDACKQAGILNDSSHSTSKDPDASKENQNFVAIQSTKSSISSKDEPFDKRSKSKIPLKRGITVNFAETSYPIIHDTKNQNYTSYMCHGRSFRKNRITPMISSDNTNINEDQRAISSAKKTRIKKYNVEYTKKEKCNYYRTDNYFSQNCTPNPKGETESRYNNIFDDDNLIIPFRLQTECEADFSAKKQINKDLNKSYVSVKENNFSKASFVEIQSKEDPLLIENKNTIAFSTICNEGEANKCQQLESKSHQKYNNKKHDERYIKNEIKDYGLDKLKRSKSEDKDDEYDTIIIEEYKDSINKSKRSNPKDKKKLFKAKSTTQNTTSNMSSSTAEDQKCSYRETELDVCNEYDMIITQETEYFVSKSKNKSKGVNQKCNDNDKNKKNKYYGQVMTHK